MIDRHNSHFYGVGKAAPCSKVLKSFTQGHEGGKMTNCFKLEHQFSPHSHNVFFSHLAGQQLQEHVFVSMGHLAVEGDAM